MEIIAYIFPFYKEIYCMQDFEKSDNDLTIYDDFLYNDLSKNWRYI